MTEHERMNYWWARAKAAEDRARQLEVELAESKAKAWAEGFGAGHIDAFDADRPGHTCTPNPYNSWLTNNPSSLGACRGSSFSPERNLMKHRKIAAAGAIALASAFGLAACSSDADVASQNLSTDSDNFKVPRRVVFVNGITDKYLLEIQGYCSINADREDNQLEVTCKTGDGFKKHYLGISDNATYFVEQIEGRNVSTDFYKVTFKPTEIIPQFEFNSGN